MRSSYWINTISLDHVTAAKEGGFTQANHGNPQNLSKLCEGDYVVFYSPKTEFKGSEPLQEFTAIGQVTAMALYQVTQTRDFHPYRRGLTFLECESAPIKPLVDSLSFIHNKTHWGMVFRQGMFEIPEVDFKIIATAMHQKIVLARGASIEPALLSLPAT